MEGLTGREWGQDGLERDYGWPGNEARFWQGATLVPYYTMQGKYHIMCCLGKMW